MLRKLIIAIALLAFWPLGLFLVWKYSGWETLTKWTATVLAAGLVVAGVVAGLLTLGDDDQNRIPQVPSDHLLKSLDEVSGLLGGTPTPSNEFSAAELRQVLLTLEDLSAGWSITDQSGFVKLPGAIAGASVEFEGSTSDLEHMIHVFPSGEADFAMADLATLRSCEEGVNERGAYRLCPMAFPKLGEETLARSVTMQDVPVVLYIVHVRRGDLIISLWHTGLDSMDAEETKAFARRADEKLAALEATGSTINR